MPQFWLVTSLVQLARACCFEDKGCGFSPCCCCLYGHPRFSVVSFGRYKGLDALLSFASGTACFLLCFLFGLERPFSFPQANSSAQTNSLGDLHFFFAAFYLRSWELVIDLAHVYMCNRCHFQCSTGKSQNSLGSAKGKERLVISALAALKNSRAPSRQRNPELKWQACVFCCGLPYCFLSLTDFLSCRHKLM